MAIYHLSAQVISRSSGRSSVAASAYRGCEKLIDERTGELHDYSKKQDLLHKEILLPKGAPSWMQDRQKLWNHVEDVEKRKDSQLAREVVISLPRELDSSQNIILAHEFAREHFVSEGMVADVCIHNGHKGQDDQPHAHIMISTRKVTDAGFGQKVRAWNDKALLVKWREGWADICNRHLALHGHDIRIDHRSYQDQGINLEPQTKIGPRASRSQMAKFEQHQQIAHENGERILKNPTLALDAITRGQSTFTNRDLARFVNRHTSSSAQFEQVFAKVKESRELVVLGKDKTGQERFTTVDQLKLERNMVEGALQGAARFSHPVNHSSQEKIANSYGFNPSQQKAYEHILSNKDTSCVVGFAGSGKSYLLQGAAVAWEKEGYFVQGMSLSKKVADDLEASSGMKSNTIANRLINWENGRERLTAKDIVVVDEAGMVSSRQMAAIVSEVESAKAKLVLVGDWQQLQAIEAGASFRAIAERVGYSELNVVMRQREPWQRAATEKLAIGDVKTALNAYEKHGAVHQFETKAEAVRGLLENWQETKGHEPDKSHLLLAYTRADVKALNVAARQMRKECGELGAEREFETHQGIRTFAEGDRIVCLKNEKSLGVSNGTLGTVKALAENEITISLDKPKPGQGTDVTISTDFYKHIDHGYASTIHKNQGSTVDRAYVLGSQYFDRHTTYVAFSRHKDSCDFYYDKETFKNEEHLHHTLSRERAKDITLDYTDKTLVERHYNDKIDKSHQEMVKVVEERLEKRTSVHLDKDIQESLDKNIQISDNRETEIKTQLEAKLVEREIKELSQDIGKDVSMSIEQGDKGIYRGTTTIGDKTYGMLEQEKTVKLLERSHCEDLRAGKEYEISKEQGQDKESEIEVTPCFEKERGRGSEMEIGF